MRAQKKSVWKSGLFTALLFFCMMPLGACSFAPQYEQPVMDIPADWNRPAGAIQAGGEWWKRFNDPVLNTLVEKAMSNNRNLVQAASKVEQARISLGLAHDNYFPTPMVNAAANSTYATGRQSETYGLMGGANAWEPDFWGKVRNSVNISMADLLSAEAGRDSVMLSVVSGTVKSYFWVRAYEMQETTSLRVLKSREAAQKIYEERYKQGQINEFDLYRNKAEVESARNTLYSVRMALDQSQSALGLLIGSSPKELMENRFVPEGLSIEKLPSALLIPEGLPSDLLIRRPDIRQAEQNLRKTNYSIGIAKANYFPSFSLTGLLGVLSPELSSMFNSSDYGKGEAAVTLPLDFWRTQKKVRVAEEQKKEAIAAYEYTVQNGFREMRDALNQQEQYSLSVKTLEEEVRVLRMARDHAQSRYDNGYSSYLELLDAERSLFSVELSLIAARANQLVSQVNVCEAYGGGW